MMWFLDTFLWATFFVCIDPRLIRLSLISVGSPGFPSNPVLDATSESKDTSRTEGSMSLEYDSSKARALYIRPWVSLRREPSF